MEQSADIQTEFCSPIKPKSISSFKSPRPERSESPSTCRSPFQPKQRLRCVFCRGSNCNRCGITAYTDLENPAFEKVHSSWIDDSIVAMQRPSDEMFEQVNLLDQFDANGIGAVFNLSEAGEHPYCGQGNLATTGFPYSPEKLMKRGINHFNFSWADMTTPSIPFMLNIVQVACHQLSENRKIVVHCHAGYGRTGLAIACILIARNDQPAEEAVARVRSRRPGSLQTKAQVAFVSKFYLAWLSIMQIFPRASMANYVPSSSDKSIAQSITDQQQTLSCAELAGRRLRWVPKVLDLVCKEMVNRGNKVSHHVPSQKGSILLSCVTGLSVVYADEDGLCPSPRPWDVVTHPEVLEAIESIRTTINRGCWDSFEQALTSGHIGNMAACVQIALDWHETRSDRIFDEECFDELISLWYPEAAEQAAKKHFDDSSASAKSDSCTVASTDCGHNDGSYGHKEEKPSYSHGRGLDGNIRSILAKHLCRSRRETLYKLVELINTMPSRWERACCSVRIAITCIPSKYSSSTAAFMSDRSLRWDPTGTLIELLATSGQLPQSSKAIPYCLGVSAAVLLALANADADVQ